MLATMYNNVPSRLTPVDNLGTSSIRQIKFADRPSFRSCEDALLVESLGVAIVACDPGRDRWNTVMGVNVPEDKSEGEGRGPVPGASLYIYDYKTFPNGGDDDDDKVLRTVGIIGFPVSSPGERDLHTLGMAFDEPSSTLLVTNHAMEGGSRIEVFELDGLDSSSSSPPLLLPKATHIRTIKHPLLHAPNSIAIVEGTGGAEFFVTNDHAIPSVRSKLLSVIETYVAAPTGTVVYVRVGDGEVKAHVVARLPFANGIVIFNATTIAVSSSSKAAVYLFKVQPAFGAEGKNDSADTVPYTLTYASRIRTTFAPDNLSVAHSSSSSSSSGKTEAEKLLIAGHAHAPTLSRYVATRHVCHNEDPAVREKADPEMQAYCERTETGIVSNGGSGGEAAPSWVSEWSEEHGLKTLYVGMEYPSSATAAWDAGRGVGIIAGLSARGLFVWKE